jgi:hypothetical protein
MTSHPSTPPVQFTTVHSPGPPALQYSYPQKVYINSSPLHPSDSHNTSIEFDEKEDRMDDGQTATFIILLAPSPCFEELRWWLVIPISWPVKSVKFISRAIVSTLFIVISLVVVIHLLWNYRITSMYGTHVYQVALSSPTPWKCEVQRPQQCMGWMTKWSGQFQCKMLFG